MKKGRDYVLVGLVIICSIIIFIFKEYVVKIGEWGYIGIFILCFLSNITVFLPAPSLMVVVSYSQVLSPVGVALIGALGTTFGEASGYLLGEAIKNISTKWDGLIKQISRKIHNIYILIFIFALLPLPIFDFVGVYAGSKKVKMPYFLILCYCGKLLKMLFYTVFVGSILLKKLG